MFGSSASMAWVPFPWWMSQSTIKTLNRRFNYISVEIVAILQNLISIYRFKWWNCVAYLAATAILLKMQKPHAVSSSAWWPGGLTIATPDWLSPFKTLSTTCNTEPAATQALDQVSVCKNTEFSLSPFFLNSPGFAEQVSFMSWMCLAVWASSNSSSVASRPGNMWQRSSNSYSSCFANIPDIRLGLSGWVSSERSRCFSIRSS